MSFKTKYGHELNVGDKVVAVVQGYSHSIRTIEGIFIGLSKSGNFQILAKDRWNPKKTYVSTLQRNYIFPVGEHYGNV